MCSAVSAAPLVPDPDALPPLQQGFSKGFVYFSMGAGDLGPPRGSLIDHEKQHDAQLRAQALSGTLPVKLLNINVPPTVIAPFFDTTFSTGTAYQFDLEYALTDHVGLGLSHSQLLIRMKQQDVISTYSTAIVGGEPTLRRSDSIFLLPLGSSLYDGNLVQVLLTYHFLSNHKIDPFVALRLGGSRFHTMAHAELNPLDPNPDQFRYLRQTQGSGRAVGLGAGTNVHFTDQYAIHVELAGQRQYLKSDLFPRRSLTTYQFTAGLTINVTRFADME